MPAANPDAAAVPHAHADEQLMATAMVVVQSLLADALARATPPELLDLSAVLAMTSQSRSSWYRAMSAGEAPQAVATPAGKRWRRRDVLKWVERLK